MLIPNNLVAYLKTTGTSPGKCMLVQNAIDRDPESLEKFYQLLISYGIPEGTMAKIRDFLVTGGKFESSEDLLTITKEVRQRLEGQNEELKDQVAALKIELAERHREIDTLQEAKHASDARVKELRDQLDRLTEFVDDKKSKIKSPAGASKKK